MQPLSGRERWIELEEIELNLLGLAGRSLSLLEMVEEVVEERLSQEDDDDEDEDEEDFDYDDEDDVDEDEEDDDDEDEAYGFGLDAEEMETLRIEGIKEDVMDALGSLYEKRLIDFEE